MELLRLKSLAKSREKIKYPIIEYIMEYFFNNILEHGSIMASPCEEPNYRFHWVRDAAIVIKSVITL